MARALVQAEAEGQVGHGFSRLADYAAQVQSGKIVADAAISVTKRAPAALHVDAGLGFAYPALEAALEAGVPLAQDMGIAVMTVGNSHHCGTLSAQVERLAEAGLVRPDGGQCPQSHRALGRLCAAVWHQPHCLCHALLQTRPRW